MARVATRKKPRALPPGFVLCPRCQTAVRPIIAGDPDATRACPICRGFIADAPAKGPRKKPEHHEEIEHTAVVERAKAHEAVYPDLRLLFHPANGGTRNTFEASRLRDMGVQPGVLDLWLPVARGGYFGLAFDMKATREQLGRKPEVSKEQRRWIADLTDEGWYAAVCEGRERAWSLLIAYVNLPRTARGPVLRGVLPE